MPLESLRDTLETLDAAQPLLAAWGVRDLAQGWRNFRQLADALGFERLNELLPWLDRHLPACSDPDMALNNLERFLARREATEQPRSI